MILHSRQALSHFRSRRGFALVLSLGILAVLGTYLLAAQTSVVNSARNVNLSVKRQERALQLNSVLDYARATARALQRDGFEKDVPIPEEMAEGVTVTVESLNDTSSLYGKMPLSFREGDVHARVSWEAGQNLPAAEQEFLINIDGQRSGAIRLQ